MACLGVCSETSSSVHQQAGNAQAGEQEGKGEARRTGSCYDNGALRLQIPPAVRPRYDSPLRSPRG